MADTNNWRRNVSVVVRKTLTVLFLICYPVFAYNQVIKGTVLDIETKSPVGFAYLYFSGTFTGTQSDQNGNFELDVSKNKSIPLTISAIGYYSSTLTDFSSTKPLRIFLTPKVYPIKEITVNASSLAKRRKSNLILFKNIFLGTTNNARLCHILNEDDISFNYESDRDTLKAFAMKPVIIENKALGYNITYYLDRFEYARKDRTFLFEGTIAFNEDLTNDAALRETYLKKREKAYLGSRMHFFRALWLDDLRKDGFTVKDNEGSSLKYEDLVSEDGNHNKYLSFSTNVQICYKSSVPSSQMVFLKNKVLFSSDGYFDSSAIMWEGAMANLRMADWLPFEYFLFK